MRGALTKEIKQAAKDYLDLDEFTTQALRLIPYIIDCSLNSRNISPKHINTTEREILSDWRKRGLIRGGASELTLSRKFWDGAAEILWLSYVNT